MPKGNRYLMSSARGAHLGISEYAESRMIGRSGNRKPIPTRVAHTAMPWWAVRTLPVPWQLLWRAPYSLLERPRISPDTMAPSTAP